MTSALPTASSVPIDKPRIKPLARDSAEFNVAAHGLRGLASLMVLCAHIIGGTAKHIYPHVDAYTQFVEHPWYLGTYGVNLFFVISGFVIVPSALKYAPRDFAVRRFLRIYPLFFVLSVLFILLNILTNAYPGTNNFESVVAGLLFLNLFTGTEQLTPNAWSLTFEVMFYVLTSAVVYATVRRPQPVLAAIAIVACVAFFVAFPISVFFVIGVAIRVVHQKFSLATTYTRGLEVLCLLLAVFFASQGHFEYRWQDFADPVVIPIIILTGLYFYLAVAPGSLTSMVMSNRIASYLGMVSYSLYLVHPYVYFGVRAIFVRYGWFTVDVFQSMTFFAVVVIALSFAASHFVHISLERWPYQWFFRQRIYRNQARGE